MDWQRVKEKVTDEVLRQLQTGGVTATPEKVQQMVVQALSDKSSTSVPAPSGGAPSPAAAAPAATAVMEPPAATSFPACDVGPDFKTDLLVVMAGPVCDSSVAVIKQLAASHKVTVISSGFSQRLVDVQACGQVICEGNEATAKRLVAGAGRLVVPVITTSTAAKVANLIGDCLASSVLVQAALLGKSVTIARESMAAPQGAAWSIRQKVEEVSSSLRTLGFTLTDLPALTRGGEPAGKTGGYVPAYQPHPAVLASRALKAEANRAKTTADSTDFDRELARMIDHTLLKPESTMEQVTKLCQEAIAYSFMSVCVNPTWVPLCAKLLKGSVVKVCTVIGFPLGATSSTAKALEAADAIAHGATEVDMVLNIGALKSGEHARVLEDVKAVVQAAKGQALVKVILETGLLTNEEKVKACELCKQAGADFVKTSTGFGPGGATVEDIALMRKTVGPNIGVKASGGIRDYETTRAMVAAGATRIGASAGINIVKRVQAKPAAGKEKY